MYAAKFGACTNFVTRQFSFNSREYSRSCILESAIVSFGWTNDNFIVVFVNGLPIHGNIVCV